MLRRHLRAHVSQLYTVCLCSNAVVPFARRLIASGGARAVALIEDTVLSSLRSVKDDIVGKDIVSLGCVKNLRVSAEDVTFDIQFPTPAHPRKSEMVAAASAAAQQALRDTPGHNHLNVHACASVKPRRSQSNNPPKALSRVSTIIAVSSCKGGTGKSTVAVNLACSLAATGAQVGIFDADLYGPSLPTLISPESVEVFKDEDTGTISPVDFHGMKAMSYGYVGAVGTVALRLAFTQEVLVPQIRSSPRQGNWGERHGSRAWPDRELNSATEWGELDYLVLDLPPGTGDITLTLCQQLQIAGAVVVTTPHKLSFVDVVKGIGMFDRLRVPTVALVENMAYFECPSCAPELLKTYGFEASTSLPLHDDVAASANGGKPLVLSSPGHPVSQQYSQLRDDVVTALLHAQFKTSGSAAFDCTWHAKTGRLVLRHFLDNGAHEFDIAPRALRLQCRCAACVDELTDQALLVDEDVPSDVVPVAVSSKGNYAVSIAWSDGHSSIFTFETLLQLCRTRKNK